MTLLYDCILQEVEEEYALDWARGFCFGDEEFSEQPMPKYHTHIDTIDGVEVYYDFGADYYFFAVPEEIINPLRKHEELNMRRKPI